MTRGEREGLQEATRTLLGIRHSTNHGNERLALDAYR
jgi:hypothetical protein